MEWSTSLSQQATKFLLRHHLPDTFVLGPVTKAIRRLSGEIVAVDLKRLSGSWAGYFKVRIGKVRIIFSMDFEENTVFVEVIDFRGGAYK